MKIAVVCGGLSNERDVSITSGTNIARALREKGHKVVLLDLYYGYTGREYSDPAELFEREQEDISYSVKEDTPDIAAILAAGDGSRIGKNVIEICRAADISFLALHGDDGENGKLQATFDMYGIKYTGSGYLGSAMAMNKEVSKIMLAAHDIPTPAGIVLHKGEAIRNVGFPCVVKPCSGGSSIGTSLVADASEYEKALELAFEFEDSVVVEQYIKGRELTCGVMGESAMPVIEIIPKAGWYDYKNKYQAGCTEEICPAPLSKEETERVQRLAERVKAALMIDVYCRADFMMDGESGEIYCLEANTLSGMTPTSLIPQMAAEQGMDFGELCEKIIKISLEKYK